MAEFFKSRLTWMMIVAMGVMALFSLTAAGQDSRGKVQGTVVDPSGAVVVGVQVTLTNVKTGVSVVRQTGANGHYLFDFVDPGEYSITAEMAGFKKTLQENVSVLIRGDVTVNLSLQVGELKETVTVSEAPPTVEFNTATMGQTLEQKMIKDLPVMGRNVFSLSLLNPSVVNQFWENNPQPYKLWAPVSYDIGGANQRTNDLLLDGTTVQVGTKGSYTPNMDAVQEFSVQQNSVDTEFGNSAGGIFSLSSKSGTNEYHGSAYYFGRNPVFNARPYVNSTAPSTSRNHIWGASGGGPILKNKLFTFISYEGQRTKQPYQNVWTMPTDAELTGDFSHSFNADGSLRTIYDPWSTRPDPNNPGNYIRDPFSGNIIPQNRLDPSAVELSKAWWKPNNPGLPVTGANNFIANYDVTTKYFNFTNRTDWNVNDKLKIFGRYSRLIAHYVESDFTGGSIARNDNYASPPLARNISGDAVYTLNPQTVLNFRMSYASLDESYHNPQQAITSSTMKGYWPNSTWYEPIIKELPEFYYPALVGLGAEFGKGLWWLQPPHTYSITGKVARQQGKHALKAGMEWRRHSVLSLWPSPFQYSFDTQYTSNTFINPSSNAGNAYATFLLGAIDSNSAVAISSPVQLEHRAWGAYFQDDFKVNQRITLNLGLRWEYMAAPYDSERHLSRYVDLTQPIPEFQNAPPMPPEVTAIPHPAPIYNGYFNFTTDGNKGIWNAKNEFMPRVGIAIRLTDKSALRAGYARYVQAPVTVGDTLNAPQPNAYGWGGNIPLYGYNQKYSVAPSLQGIPQAHLSDPFPASNPMVLPKGQELGRYTALGDDVFWNQQAQKTQINDRINVSYQMELPFKMAADVTWFLNLGHRVPYDLNVNMVDPNLYYTYKDALNQVVANPFYNFLTPDKFPGQLRNQQYVTVGRLLGPYPQYGSMTQKYTDGRLARYNSLQAKLERRFEKGLGFLWNYNYNNANSQEFFNDVDQYAKRWTTMPSANYRHMMNLVGMADIPVGRGRHFGSNMNKIAEMVLGGWGSNLIYTRRSASYLRFGTYKVSGDPSISNPNLDNLFDASKFADQPAYTPRSNPWQYSGIKGLGNWNIDATLSKVFRINERFNMELRMEAYNLTNSVMWTEDWATTYYASWNSNFGKAHSTQRNMGREMQYMLRLNF